MPLAVGPAIGQGERQLVWVRRVWQVNHSVCKAPIMIDPNLFLAFAAAVTVLMLIPDRTLP